MNARSHSLTPCGQPLSARVVTLLVAISILIVGTPASRAADPALFTPGSLTLEGITIPYQLFIPAVSAGNPSASYPLVIYLHGVGSRGDNNTAQLGSALVNTFVGSSLQSQTPCFVLAPQCPNLKTWSSPDVQSVVKEVFDSIVRDRPVDADRIYLTGWSMGGMGTLAYLEEFPGFFAAAIPCSGSGDPSAVQNISRSAVWLSHGTLDPSVPVSGSIGIAQALESAGNPVRSYRDTVANMSQATALDTANLVPAKFVFTELTDGNHVDGQRAAAGNPLMPQWLFSKNRSTLPPGGVLHTLDPRAGEGGSVTPAGLTRHAVGTTVTITAIADAGYTFSAWSGDADGNDNPLTVTMDADQTITAGFTGVPPTGSTLRWSGLNGNTWEGPQANWLDEESQVAGYTDGDAVRLDDTAASGTLTLGVTVSPPQVTIDNSNRSFLINGPGILAGGGRLVKQGSGTLTLAVANELRGGTLVEDGVLRVGAGGTTVSLGSGPVVNHGSLVIDRGGLCVVAAPISGPGTLQKTSSGTLVLSGANTHTGPVLVAAGTMLVDGDSSGSTSTITVAAGARLGGGGRIGGAVVLEAGASATSDFIHPLIISGPLTLNDNPLHVSTPEASEPGSYTLMTYDPIGSSGAFHSEPVITGAGLAPDTSRMIVTSNGVVSLVVTALNPPPVTWVNEWTVGTQAAGTANWSNPAIWLGSLVPGSRAGDMIEFAAPGNNATVINDFGSIVLGGMTFGARPGKNYTIGVDGNAHALTFDNRAKGASLANSPGETSGRLTINAPVIMADTLTVINNASTTGSVILGGVISGGGTNQPLIVNAAAGNGTGGVQLTRSNTYTGVTRVISGKLALSAGGSIASSAAVHISPDAVLDTTAKSSFAPAATQPLVIGIDPAGEGRSGRLAAAGLNIAQAEVRFEATATLDDPAYVIATYSSLAGTVFAHAMPPEGYAIDYTHGGGTAIALTRIESGFTNWAISHGLTELRFDRDSDGDGLADGLEYAIGSNPRAFTAVPTPVPDADGLTFTCMKGSAAASDPRIAYRFEISPDLREWSEVAPTSETGTSVTYKSSTGDHLGFLRLKIIHEPR